METDFDTIYRAWELNQQQGNIRTSSGGYGYSNVNAVKIAETEIDAIIDRVKAGEKLTTIYEEKYQTVCGIDAIRNRIRKRGIMISELNRKKRMVKR